VFGGEDVWRAELETLTDEKTGKTRPNAAVKVLAHHWPDVPNLGDISEINWNALRFHIDDIPGVSFKVDILCGGFPCQDVSSAGLRAGIAEGTRSGLWSMFAKAIAALRPKVVVIENVRGLLSAEAHRGMEPAETVVGDRAGGPVLRAAGAVLGDLADLGYDAQWTTVSAASVGAPHQRDRVFILATDAEGHGRDTWWSEPARFLGRPDAAVSSDADVALLPTPTANSDGSAADLDKRQKRLDAAKARHGRIFGETLDVAIAKLSLLPTPCAARSGNNQSASPGAAVRPSLDSITDLLPTPRRSDGDGGANPLSRAERMDDVETRVIRLLNTPSCADGGGGHLTRSGARNDEALLPGQAVEMAHSWGKYEPAIHRWESVTRPAPSPTEPNTKGNPRLAPAFPEWMQGFDAGWITAVPGISRNDQLRIIGNSVCPQQAESALRQLIQVCEVAA